MCIALKHYCLLATMRPTMTTLTVAHHSFSPVPMATIKSCRSYSLWALILPTGRGDSVWEQGRIMRKNVYMFLSISCCLNYSRDDEHRTALMLAAEEGHTLVMKILLDNHAPVNELDKLKVSDRAPPLCLS